MIIIIITETRIEGNICTMKIVLIEKEVEVHIEVDRGNTMGIDIQMDAIRIDIQMDAMGIDIQMKGTVVEKICIAVDNKRKNEYIIFHNNLLQLKYCQY